MVSWAFGAVCDCHEILHQFVTQISECLHIPVVKWRIDRNYALELPRVSLNTTRPQSADGMCKCTPVHFYKTSTEFCSQLLYLARIFLSVYIWEWKELPQQNHMEQNENFQFLSTSCSVCYMTLKWLHMQNVLICKKSIKIGWMRSAKLCARHQPLFWQDLCVNNNHLVHTLWNSLKMLIMSGRASDTFVCYRYLLNQVKSQGIA